MGRTGDLCYFMALLEMDIDQFRFNAVDAVACSGQQGQTFSEHG